MTWLKRIGIALGIAAVLGAAGFMGLKRYVETYSFAPESEEQESLANEHARCAGYYMVLRSSLKKERPDYAELERNYTAELERHAKMGFNYSPDKDGFKSKIESAAAEFGNQVVAAAEKDTVAALVDKRMDDCFATGFRSIDFVKRTLEQRAVGR